VVWMKKVTYTLCTHRDEQVFIVTCRGCPHYRDETYTKVICDKGEMKKISEVWCRKENKWIFTVVCDSCIHAGNDAFSYYSCFYGEK